MLPKPLLKFLELSKIKYETIKHRIVYTAFDKANTLHLPPKMVVKTAVLRGDKNYFLALIPADKLLDKNKAKSLINAYFKKHTGKAVKSLGFAKETWMKKNISFKIGATPAFGPFFKVKGRPEALLTLIDNALLNQPKLIVNSGEYGLSLKLNKADLIKALSRSFIRGSFSKTKK